MMRILILHLLIHSFVCGRRRAIYLENTSWRGAIYLENTSWKGAIYLENTAQETGNPFSPMLQASRP